jgi:Fe2+ or Zn2+ uptake regulation protein
MTDSSHEYRAAYESAQKELADLLLIQEAIEKRIVVVRQNVQGLKELCESEAVKITPSQEAKFLLDNSRLPDEIENVLRSRFPDELRAADVRMQLEKLGHDMDAYTNPLATVHMVLKRLIESGRVRERQHAQGFRVYQFVPRTPLGSDITLDPKKFPERIRQLIEGPRKMVPRTRTPKKKLPFFGEI